MNKIDPYHKGAMKMLDLILEGNPEHKEKYLLLWNDHLKEHKKKKYATREEAYEAHKKQAREHYWKKKGITHDSIQKRIDDKRNSLTIQLGDK